MWGRSVDLVGAGDLLWSSLRLCGSARVRIDFVSRLKHPPSWWGADRRIGGDGSAGFWGKDRVRGAFHEVEQVAFGIFEEQDPAAAAGWFWKAVELDAPLEEFVLGRLEGVDAQGQVTPAVERVVGCFLEAEIAFIDFEQESTGQAEEEGGRRLVVGVDQFGLEGVLVPFLEGDRVPGRQSEMFHRVVHGSDIRGLEPAGTQNTEISRGFTEAPCGDSRA